MATPLLEYLDASARIPRNQGIHPASARAEKQSAYRLSSWRGQIR
jgi:hypothetical protein